MSDFSNQLARLQGMASSSNQRDSTCSDEDEWRRRGSDDSDDDDDGINRSDDIMVEDFQQETSQSTWANRDMAPRMEQLCHSLDAIPVDELKDTILLSALHSAVQAWHYKQEWREDEADLAEAILLRLEQEELEGYVLKQEGYIPLEARNYVSVIHAYAKCHNSATAARKAEDILNHMDNRAKAGDAQFIPNRLAINTTIGAYAKSTQDHAPMEAERLLNRLENEYSETGDESVRPSTRSYGKVIDAWCRSKQEGAIKNAVLILKRLELQFESGNIDTNPNSICYSTIIFALAKGHRGRVSAATMAQEVFDSMLSHFEAGISDFEPEESVFSALINLWIKSGCSERAEKAYQAFLQMKKYGLHGDTLALNNVINALAQRGDEASLEKAESVLGVLESDPCLKANFASYHCLLKAYNTIGCAEQFWKHWNQEYVEGRTEDRPVAFGVRGFSAVRTRLRHQAEIEAAAEANSIRFWREVRRENISKKRKASEIADA